MFSTLVLRVGYKPTARIALGSMAKTRRLNQMRFASDRKFYFRFSRHKRYEVNDPAEVAEFGEWNNGSAVSTQPGAVEELLAGLGGVSFDESNASGFGRLAKRSRKTLAVEALMYPKKAQIRSFFKK
jgi:hypothetical protein